MLLVFLAGCFNNGVKQENDVKQDVPDNIHEVREQTFESSAVGIFKAAENEFYRRSLNGETDEVFYVFQAGEESVWTDPATPADYDKLAIGGTMPDYGVVHIAANGAVTLWLYDGTYCATKDSDDTQVETVKTENRAVCVAKTNLNDVTEFTEK